MARSAQPSSPLLWLLLLRAAAIASAGCSVYWSVRCEYSGEATSSLTLLVEDDDDDAFEPYAYDVSRIVFHWGPRDTSLGTRTYSTGVEVEIEESYVYEPEGEYDREYYIGYTFTLVDVCGGKSFWDYKLLQFKEGEDCAFDDVETSNVPTRSDSEPPTALPTLRPTPPPSRQPTVLPSRRPTPAPTPSPTENPSDLPTNSPTKRPTNRPTKRPTKRPAARPTLRPSANPTLRPTDQPIKRPTRQPTREPSLRPTAGPTKRPTARPTPLPTRNPTDRPTDTRAPAPRPTLAPPSRRPTTAAPSERPEVLQLVPKSSPFPDDSTGWPTAAGTNLPLDPPEFFTCGDGACSAAEHVGVCRSDCAGIALDAAPEGGDDADVRGVMFSVRSERNILLKSMDVLSTNVGAVAVREEADRAASRVEVFAKAGGHRGYESASEAWTAAHVGHAGPGAAGHSSATTLVFNNGEGVPVRESETASFFVFAEKGRVRCRIGMGGIGDVATSDGVLELHQGVEVNEKWATVDGDNEGVVPLVLVGSLRYDIVASFPTAVPAPDSIEVAGSGKTLNPTPATTHPEPMALNLPSPQALSSSNDIVSPTAEPTVQAAVEPAVDQSPGIISVVGGDTEGDGNSTYIIVAAVTGGACVFLIAVVAGNYYVKQMNSTGSKKTKSTLAAALEREPPDFEPVIKAKHKGKDDAMIQPVATIESKEGEMDDVSTLGDPYLGDAAIAMGADNTIGESMISSQQELYVYGVRKSQGMGASRMGGSTINSANYRSPVFGDDITLEDMFHSQHDNSTPNFRRLTVAAPPGELGIILNNSHGEVPIVWAIKETSALHGEVRVGDALLSVDGVDCRGMSTQEVSTFLSGRSRNPTRMLAMARSCEVVEVGSEMLGV